MKASIWHLSFVLLACLGLVSTLSTPAYGQQPPTGQSGSGVGGAAACDNPPCVMELHGPGLRALLLELYTMKAEPEPGLGICG